MRNSIFVRFALLLLAIVALSFGVAAQKRPPRIKPVTASVTVSASNPTPAQRRYEAFSTAWYTIDQFYFDKTFGGLDWNKIRKEFEPRVRAAKTDLQFHRILEEMINRLGKSHLAVIIPEYFEHLETAQKQARIRGKQMAAARSANRPKVVDETSDSDEFGDPARFRYGIGVELRMIGSQIVITRVEKQSGAALAGLKPGYVIEKINGVSLKEMIDGALISGTSAADLRYLLPIQIGESFLNGEPDTSVFVTCLDETDTAKEFTVPRLELAGEAISISKNLPQQFLKYEASSLSDDVGYIKFNAFAVPVIEKFCESLSEFGSKKAIIVDLRGNLGGILGSMFGLSGMMTDKSITLGQFVSRTASEPFTAPAKNKNFKGRIVILVDGMSMSAAEMFTAGLQGTNRAIVVGERTGGQSLPAVWTKLSTGAVMVYPVADFITPKGVSLEGTGLEPDHTVVLDRKSLLNGIDPQLQRAVTLTADDKAFPVRPVTKLVLRAEVDLKEAPPPPPPTAAPKPVFLARTQPTPAPAVAASDARSLKVVADFLAAVGGSDALKRVTSYEARGTMAVGPTGETDGELYAARQFPDKYVMVLSSAELGEIREIYNGKTSSLQADYGLDSDLYPNLDTTRSQLFAALFDTLEADYLKGLKFEGEYEIEGRRRQILTATDPRGLAIGLSFDAATKMLITYSVPGLLYTFGDYRRTDGISLPYSVGIEGMMKVQLASIIINPKLEPSIFEKKEKCFDKAN